MVNNFSKKAVALGVLVAASAMVAGAFASDKTEPRNDIYKDKFSK